MIYMKLLKNPKKFDHISADYFIKLQILIKLVSSICNKTGKGYIYDITMETSENQVKVDKWMKIIINLKKCYDNN